MQCFICSLPLSDQLRPLRRRQIAADQVFVDFGKGDFAPSKMFVTIATGGVTTMKHLRSAITVAFAVLTYPAAHSIAAEDPFRACVAREAKSALGRAVTKFGEGALYGYHKDENAEVFSICKQRSFDGSIRSDIDDAKFVYETIEKMGKQLALESIRKADEVQRKKDELAAPRLKAEKALEDQAAQNYLLCLDNNTRVLAVNSSEPAETIAQAAFASCRSARQGVFDAYRGHTNSFSTEAMAAMEQAFQRQLLLVAIEARAARDARPPTPVAPAPTKRGTPI